MKLIFERSVPGRRCSILPACDVEETPLPESLRRAEAPVLPELSEQAFGLVFRTLQPYMLP